MYNNWDFFRAKIFCDFDGLAAIHNNFPPLKYAAWSRWDCLKHKHTKLFPLKILNGGHP